MEYVYSAMLLHKAGKEISEANVKKVLESAGVKVEDARVKALVAALEGVDIDKAIKEAAVTVAAQVVAPVEEKAKKEEKNVEEEKKSEEQAAAGLGALFG